MANLVKEEKYILTNVDGNNNKFWYIELYDNNEVITRNGRVGNSPQVHPKQLSSESAALSFFDTKTREKTNKGYSLLKVINAKPSEKSVNTNSLADIALKQIESTSPETAKLIKYLSQKNVHNIVSATTIKYDEKAGTFTTPCGIVTQDGIDEARDLLDKLIPFIKSSSYEDREFITNLQNYLQLIPHDVGRKLSPKSILPNLESIEKEAQILDALTASLQQTIVESDDDKVTEEVEAPKVFSVKLDLVTDESVIKRLTKFYESTKKSMHTSSILKVKTIYSVEIESMKKAFDEKGSKVGNVRELWHGTRVENVLSILKSGLVMPKPSNSNFTGSMFGLGIYGSDQSTKSLNYAQGYWSKGAKDNNCFMFVMDMAMGKEYIPSGPSQNLPKPGYDSTYAVGGKSGVMNNEMIVYNINQVNLKYLIEFSEN